MYENLAYDQLKNLPDNEKAEALKQLQSLFGSNKEIAAKLGTAPIAISNMIKKYVEGKQVGRTKKEPLQVEQLPEVNSETKPKRTYNRKNKDAKSVEQSAIESVKESTVETTKVSKDESFTISIKKTVSGEIALGLLNGVGSTLIKDKQYEVEVKIIEK